MGQKVAVMNIVFENTNLIETFNEIFHDFRDYIIGRMGLPYRVSNNVIMFSVAIEAPQDIISTLSEKIGKLEGVKIKTYYLGQKQ